jgi:L-iditol 2-dehydrogenase
MIALVYHAPHDLRLEEVPVPHAGPGEVVLRVESASICGTDLRIYHGGHRKYPPGTRRIPGHETSGVVAEMGEGVTGLDVGLRVFAAPNMGCGHCLQCVSGNNNLCPDYTAIGVTTDGAFAEYVRIPSAGVLQGCLMPISDQVDPAAAALIEPFACVLRGQHPLKIQPGESVLVSGAGPIGLLHLKLALLHGAGKVIVSEPVESRRELALSLGASLAVDPLAQDLERVVLEETGGRGADAVIVAAPSHAAQEAAPRLASIGGRINFFGGLPKDQPWIQMDANLVHYKELLVTGTTACSTFDCRQAAEIVNSGRLDLSFLVSARFPLAEAIQAFTAAEERSSLKIVIEP